jgi:hypothetical protein
MCLAPPFSSMLCASLLCCGPFHHPFSCSMQPFSLHCTASCLSAKPCSFPAPSQLLCMTFFSYVTSPSPPLAALHCANPLPCAAPQPPQVHNLLCKARLQLAPLCHPWTSPPSSSSPCRPAADANEEPYQTLNRVESEAVRAVRNSTKLTHMLLSTTLCSKITV